MNSLPDCRSVRGAPPDADVALPQPGDGDPSAPSDRETHCAFCFVLVGVLGRSADCAAADRNPDGAARANQWSMAEFPRVPLVPSLDYPADDDPMDGRLSAGTADRGPLDNPSESPLDSLRPGQGPEARGIARGVDSVSLDDLDRGVQHEPCQPARALSRRLRDESSVPSGAALYRLGDHRRSSANPARLRF